MAELRTTDRRFRGALLVLYLVWWLMLALDPWYRQDWLLENVLVLLALPVLLAVHRRLSNAALFALFVFFVLHAVGAHYTYSEVPWASWLQALFGYVPDAGESAGRNHFDRMMHLLYGLLVTPAMIQWIDTRVQQQGAWRYIIPFSVMASHAALYELIEWLAAEVFGGDLGQAYLGTQGDVWDAQKDTALALLGAAIAVLVVRRTRRVSSAS